MFVDKMIFKILEFHLLYLFNFSIELNTKSIDIFVVASYFFQFFIDARFNLIDDMLLIIRIM